MSQLSNLGGTLAEQQAYDTTGLPKGSTWIFPNLDVDEWSGTKWVRIRNGGAASVLDLALDYVPYSNSTHNYYCEATPVVGGAVLATAYWRITRETIATGVFQTAVDANGNTFAFAATDIAAAIAAFA